MAKRRTIKYSKPNIARNIQSVSKNIKKNIPVVKRTPVALSKEDIAKNPSLTKVTIVNDIPAPENSKVFIIGGGPSLSNFDFSTLEGQDVIAVNKSIEHVQSAKYFITMDYTFLQKTQLTVDDINKKADSSYFVLNTGHDYIKNVNGIFTDTRNNLQYLKLNEFSGVIQSKLDYLPSTGFGKNISEFCHGSNSGYCALQLAILAGYKEIYLLGFDFAIESNKTHFHNGYRQNTQRFQGNLVKYRANFVKSIQLSKKTNIFSCSAGSFLNSYIKQVPYFKALKSGLSVSLPQRQIKKQGDLRDLMIVGYYTVNTPYEQEAAKLIKSLNKLNLLHDISGVPNLGNWQANTRYKAKFMLDMMDKHPDKNLLYIDCDAVVHKRPELFTNYNCDVAVRWQDFRWRKNECLSGTIYMENNERTKKLCNIWAATNKSEGDNGKTFEQWNLGTAIEKMKKTDGLIAKNLPPEYTFIFDSMRRMYPNAVAVIEHFQASRKFKNKV